ncbi:MAG: PLP-dependent transferase, partial [Duodenibacillus sp.]|nr:PLP-dependent transferase [Duodenibacillus sp.]
QETPGSHSMDLIDVPAITRVCRARGVVTAIDSTWSTPLYFKPLDLGVDVVMHAATKFMAGHSDLLAGVLVANEEAWKTLLPLCVRLGGVASPDDAYMIYRGLHTMAARVERGARSTALVAAWLQRQPQVEQVLWPALEGAPGHAIWKRDFTGATSLFAVRFKPGCDVAAMIDALRLFGRGYSWGGFESLAIPSYGKRTEDPSPFGRMARFAIGMEDPDDLVADLAQAFAAL